MAHVPLFVYPWYRGQASDETENSPLNRPHTRTVLLSVLNVQAKLCQVCSVWPARYFITHAQLNLKNIDQFSL